MNNANRIERELLSLPPCDRVQLVLRAWESLAEAQDLLSNPDFDPEGLQLARQREEQLNQGRMRPLTQSEFKRRTRGA